MESLSPVQRRIHQAALRLFAQKGVSQVSISDLADEAAVARGTVYKNVESIEHLFQQVASQLSKEMHERVSRSFVEIQDPAQRLANGLRFFIRRAHEEPQWGIFLGRFAMSDASLREMFHSQATVDLMNGLETGRYQFRQEQIVGVISLISGAALTAMFLVIEGHRTWREAGSDAAELILRALGLTADEAHSLATTDLPPLPDLD